MRATWLLFACLGIAKLLAADDSNPDKIHAAGCLISTTDGFVMVENRLLNRLQLPVGRHQAGETARQTAARETYEETGLAVITGDIALKLDQDQVILYFCEPRDQSFQDADLVPLDRVEAASAMIVHPVSLKTPAGNPVTLKWRYPETRLMLQAIWPFMN